MNMTNKIRVKNWKDASFRERAEALKKCGNIGLGKKILIQNGKIIGVRFA